MSKKTQMCLKLLKWTLSSVSHQMLLRGMNAVLIVLSALELCLVISSAVMGIKALRSSQKKGNKVELARMQIISPLLLHFLFEYSSYQVRNFWTLRFASAFWYYFFSFQKIGDPEQ